MQNFHVSLPCKNIEETKQFYQKELGLGTGREGHNWMDINLFGNQITFAEHPDSVQITNYYSLDSKRLPLFHLGIILQREDWDQQLDQHKEKDYFEIEPLAFMQNKIGEHYSFFIQDPNGYYLEFKTFKDSTDLFNNTIAKYSD